MSETACPKCGANLPANSPEGLCPKCLLLAGLESQPASPEGDETSPSPHGQPGFIPPSPDELGRLFPQLEVLELIGRGGMGAVYKVRHRDLDRLVALKILPPEVGGDPAFAERFSREARALAKLNHPNIVAVFDSGKAEGLYFFMMEYIDGVNLRQAMQAGQLTAEQALAIVPQICDALQYAHDEGIVHRDIKPENVLVDRKGRVKIADFGLAKLLASEASGGRKPPENALTLTQTHQVMGTPRYMAPEQMTASHAVDHRADIYSLGVVFYELLTGEVPMGRFEPPSQRVQVDVRLDEVVLRALEREPDKRYQAASAIKTDVESISTSQIAASKSIPVPLAAGAVSPSRTWLIVAVFVGALVMFCLSAYFIIRGDIEKMDHFPAPNNVLALLACGSSIMCGLCLLAAAIAGREGVQHRWLSPGKLGCVFGATAVLLVYFAFGVAFKDPPNMTESGPDGELVAYAPNNVDAFGALGFFVAAGLSIISAIVVVSGKRVHADSGSRPQVVSVLAGGSPRFDSHIGVDVAAKSGGSPQRHREARAAGESARDDQFELQRARSELKIPAIGLMVVGVLTVLCGPLFPVIPAAVWFVTPISPAVGGFEHNPGQPIMTEEYGKRIEFPVEQVAPESLDSPADGAALEIPADEIVSPIRDQSHQDTAGLRAPAEVELQLGGENAHSEAQSAARGPNWLLALSIVTLLVALAVPVTFGALIIAGGWRMLAMTSYGLAVTASILALLPCQPLFILGLVFGIWSLVVLNRPHVKAAFEAARRERPPVDELDEQAQARRGLQRAGPALIVVGILNVLSPAAVLFGGFVLGFSFFFPGPWGLLAMLLSIGTGVLLIVGGNKLRNLSQHWSIRAAAILALLPCSVLWPLNLVAGVWTLLTLGQLDRASDFSVPEKRRALRGTSRKWKVVTLVVVAVAILTLGVGSFLLYRSMLSSLSQELPVAARAGDLNRVNTLLAWGANIEAKDQYGNPPITAASIAGHDRVVQRLIQAGASVDARDAQGETALMEAVFNGHTDVTKTLLAAGANFRAKDDNGHTPLYWAIVGGQTETAMQILSRNPADVHTKDELGQPMIVLAASHGDARMVQALLDHQAMVDDRDPNGRTPLTQAANSGKIAVMQVLVKAGADVSIKDNQGHTPIYWAVMRDQQAAVDWLLNNGAEEDGTYCLWKGFRMAIAGDYAQAVPLLAKAEEMLAGATGQRGFQLERSRFDTTVPPLFALAVLAECELYAGMMDEARAHYEELQNRMSGKKRMLVSRVDLSNRAFTTGKWDGDNYKVGEYTLAPSDLERALGDTLHAPILSYKFTNVSTTHRGGSTTRSEEGGSGTVNGIFSKQ